VAVYHILPESEPFSRTGGGASAQWVAGVVTAAGLREETIVVCPEADSSWDFPYVWVAPEMGKISLLPRPLQHPVLWRRRARFYSRLLRGFVARLDSRDVIYVHNRPEMALAMVWAQHGRIQQNPVVLAINDAQLANATRPMVRHVAGRMARVVFPTEFLQHQTYDKYRLIMRASVLPLGADEGQFYPSEIAPNPGEAPLIVYAGPLNQQSGVHVLLDAARLLTGRGIQVRVLIIDRPEPGAAFDAVPTRSEADDYLRRLRHAARDNVWIEPYAGLEQIAAAMQSASVVVCPTLADEAFGLSNVQAMASGVPVAASCVGGIPEVFFEGGALLIPPGDAIALANAVERLLGKTGIARLLRREGRESFLRNYCWSRIASAYVEMLEKLPVPLTPQRPALP
jgi:glycosyltransferase involved in cell wall biosynthesis